MLTKAKGVLIFGGYKSCFIQLSIFVGCTTQKRNRLFHSSSTLLIDIDGMELPKYKGYNDLLVTVDGLSRFVQTLPSAVKCIGEMCLDIFWEERFAKLGCM